MAGTAWASAPSSSSRTPFGSDAFKRTRGDVGPPMVAGGRAICAASTTGIKVDVAQIGRAVNACSARLSWRSLIQWRN